MVRRALKIPENFEEEYMKYYHGKMNHKELYEKFNVTNATINKWRKQRKLPELLQRRHSLIPENFEEEYMKYYNGKTSFKELYEKYNVCGSTIRNWRDKRNLPVVAQNFCAKKSALIFNLFGHKLTIRNPFKIEKVKQSISKLNASDDFDDFIEY